MIFFRDECEGIGEYRGIEGTDVWCQRQCLRYPSECPLDKCKCRAKQVPEDALIEEFFR